MRVPGRAGRVVGAALLAGAAAALVLVPGCSGPNRTGRAAPAAGGEPRPPIVAPAGPADDGRTFTLHVGQTLPVDLTGSDTTRWGAPASTGPTVVATVTSTENPVTGSAAGTFRAVAPGTAQVRADKLTRCPPGQACPQLATLWQITVLVS